MVDSTTVDELAVTKLSNAVSTALGGGRMELVGLRGVSVTRATLEPGWGAEADRDGTKPDYCQDAHDIYVVSEMLGLELDNGAGTEIAAGYAATIPPGYRSWTIGDEGLACLEFDPNK